MKHTKVLLIHPSTQYATRLAEQLNKKKQLYFFVTSIVLSTADWFYKYIPQGLIKYFGNRRVEQIPATNLYRIIRYELFLFIKKSWKSRLNEDDFYKRNSAFQKAIPDSLLQKADVVIGYDTASQIVAAKIAHHQSAVFILDVSIGHHQSREKIYNQLQKLYPAWQQSIEQKPLALQLQEKEEIQLANAIVVPSYFVRNTYIENGVSAKKILVNPFGVDIQKFLPKKFTYTSNRPIRFLFLGAVNARKGIPLLVEAWQELQLDRQVAALTIAGPGELPAQQKIPNGVELIGSVLANQRQALFNKHDVFVFPSFFEGMALVQLEAAACALPVIGTNNSGAADFIENGIEGFVLETGSKNALMESILFFIENPTKIEEMGMAARKKAESYTWDAWGDRWEKIINEVQQIGK